MTEERLILCNNLQDPAVLNVFLAGLRYHPMPKPAVFYPAGRVFVLSFISVFSVSVLDVLYSIVYQVSIVR